MADVQEWFNFTVISSKPKILTESLGVFPHIMGMWVHHVVIVIHTLITFHGDHVVKSKQFGDGQINQCHDRNGDCSTERTKSNFLLGLPRLDAVKVMNFSFFVFYGKRELYKNYTNPEA